MQLGTWGFVAALLWECVSECTYKHIENSYTCETAQDVRDELLRNWKKPTFSKVYTQLEKEFVRMMDEGIIEKPTAEWKELGRIDAKSLPTKSFLKDYEVAGVPVVINGLLDVVTGGHGQNWDREYWLNECGHAGVLPHDYKRGSNEWASHTPRVEIPFREFVERSEEEKWYIINFSLALRCPHVLKEFKVPKYFVADIFQKAPDAEARFIKDSWPCLNVGPSGTRTGLHTDSFGTHFWMTLLFGEKEWYLFDQSEAPLLQRPDGSELFRDIEVWDLEEAYNDFPLVRLLKGSKTVLMEGETIFVPSMVIHAVRNRKPNFALSSNYISRSNIDVCADMIAKHEENKGISKYKLSTALRVIASKKPAKTYRDRHLLWHEFKGWQNENEIISPYMKKIYRTRCPNRPVDDQTIVDKGYPWACRFDREYLGIDDADEL
eukprot:TRINITY_DN11348_c0_g1_i1.p1 TRINITY_DN11348_c0_g1~~TRINITY_DN11348_c0_g1_i1.p1  ORF type:complete len:435 (+),score=52.93 TRINITY_DN11348_c0_g1_i1:46-1350(+)